MKRIIILTLLFAGITYAVTAQYSGQTAHQVQIANNFENFYIYKDFFVSGQPDVNMLTWLKDHGTKMIINLRTEEENQEFATEEFDEKFVAEKLGFTYISIPLDGSDGYTPEILETFDTAIQPGIPVLIHCRSGGRATNMLMAYLIREQGFSVNEAVLVGKQMRFVFPLEQLLGVDISYSIEQEE